MQSQREVIVKVSSDHQMSYKEHEILRALNRMSEKLYPTLISGGRFESQQKKILSFLVMEKLGKNLAEIKETTKLKNVCQLGIRTIKCLKKLH